VIVLLAPSQSKSAPAGPPVDLAALAHPELTERRESLVRRVDRGLLDAPAGPAAEVYTGVLYQRLDLASLTPAAARRARERLLVASALWGVLGLEDRIPAYRLAMGDRVPRMRGGLAAWWRPALAAALPADAFVVDLRSAAYAAAWRPAEGTVVEVKAFEETPAGRRPISHMAKAVRGEVARLLVEQRRAARTPEEVAGTVEAAGERVELRPPSRKGGPWALSVVRG
jgi:hypothetical protein